jgi:hypothetical protein
MSQTDGWDGPMTGPMRGQPLTLCRIHGGWWTTSLPCPACGLASLVFGLEAALRGCQREQQDARDRRCAECRQKPAEQGR